MRLSQLLIVLTQAAAFVGASPVSESEAQAPHQYVPRNQKQSKHLRPVLEKRQSSGPQFVQGQPIDGKGKGAPILGASYLRRRVDTWIC